MPMETKANYAIVGFFTVLVIAAAFGFVYWMSQYGRTGQMVELVVNIPGSANGALQRDQRRQRA
jgi:phospholipid/cholesterol/gamma-HCH transport system substrate-binding protein